MVYRSEYAILPQKSTEENIPLGRGIFLWGLPRLPYEMRGLFHRGAIHGSDSAAYCTGASSMKMSTKTSQRIQPCAQTFTHKQS